MALRERDYVLTIEFKFRLDDFKWFSGNFTKDKFL